MKSLRFTLLFVLAIAAGSGYAQSWSSAYDAGLKAARAGKWDEARTDFQRAAAYRTEDVAGPTTLPGPVTEQRRWRNGAPYSPNFLAAYSGYREAQTMSDIAEKRKLLDTVAAEFEALIAKGQAGKEDFYFLNSIYTATDQTAKRQDLATKLSAVGGNPTFKVDTEVVSPEELSQLYGLPGGGPVGSQTGGQAPTIKLTPGITVIPSVNPLTGAVAVVDTKFALVIGNSESRLPDGGVAFAADDAQRIREALVSNAGYSERNVDLVINGTAAQISAGAKALADRIPNDATVLIFFAGAGVNLDGKDYLAGVDAENASDASMMVSKSDLYKAFFAKGANVFGFFQANRAITNGRFFGMDIPMVGVLAQTQATLPGEAVGGFIRNGKMTGTYTDAFVGVLSDMKSNQIPISEFGWEVFYKVRRGSTGGSGGGSIQTPTLPVLTHMASDARF